MQTPIPLEHIVVLPKIQVDTCVALYLLARFGKEAFPGVDVAKVLFWQELPEGQTASSLLADKLLTIGLGGGIFDLSTESASISIAKYLGISENAELQKILSWANRDYLEGKGTVSTDPIDQAFGLSGIIQTFHKALPDDPKRILDYILPLLHFHVKEEQKQSETKTSA